MAGFSDDATTSETITGFGLPTESDDDKTMVFQEGRDPLQENINLSGLVQVIKERFNRSKSKRQPDEYRWLKCYANHRGFYTADVQFTSSERSRAFIKVTKNKVLAAYAQLVDVLFAGNKFPIGVESSLVPESDMPENVHFDPADKLPPDPKSATIARPELLGPLKNFLAARLGDKLKEGVGTTPTSFTLAPIAIAAKKMEKQIHDQLEESDAGKHLRYVAFEMPLLGTGILKGPFAYDKEYPYWTTDGTYQPKTKTIPKCTAVSVWNFYPDADAKNMEECEYTVERHKLSKHQLRELKKRKHFRSESIDEAILRGPNYTNEYWESTLEDFSPSSDIERFEVLEYWGMMDKKSAEEANMEIPSSFKDMDEFQVNAWICQDQILRLVLNPFTPTRIPYCAVPYELNPYSFFGIGVAENMIDTQLAMNGFWRMAVDNAALSGNIIIEIDETNLVPGQSMEIYPGKIFRRQSGAPGQAIFGTKFPNITNEILAMYDKARQLADEVTSMPSYAHGGTNVGGMGRTASGMSMLMGAADKTIKAVVKNIDDYLLSPLGTSYFNFNMQFNFDKDFIGDLSIVAKGTESLMRNEIRSQRLLQLLQVGGSNPLTAPLINATYILKEFAASLDLDEDKCTNNPAEAAAQAMLIQQMGGIQGGNPEGSGNSQDPTGTGGGTIVPGNAPTPGAEGFTGNTAGAGNTQSTQADSASMMPK